MKVKLLLLKVKQKLAKVKLSNQSTGAQETAVSGDTPSRFFMPSVLGTARCWT